MYAPSGHNIGRRITNPGRFVLYSVLKIILRKNWKSVLILFFYDFFHFSKNEKVKKNAKKCIKEAEIEKNLSALFFLKFDLESTVEDQNFKKINNEASRAKTIFSRKKNAKLCILTRGGGKFFLYHSVYQINQTKFPDFSLTFPEIFKKFQNKRLNRSFFKNHSSQQNSNNIQQNTTTTRPANPQFKKMHHSNSFGKIIKLIY